MRVRPGPPARRGARQALSQAIHVQRFGLSLIMLVALATAAQGAAGARAWEPVVIAGTQLSPLLGVPVNTVEVLARRDGKLQPIPFQVDSPDARCLPGEENSAPLRAADELAMMIADFGDAADAATPLPAGARAIAIRDPLGGPDRYAYVVAVQNPLRSPLAYVQFDAAAERVETDFYRFGLRHGWPSDFTDQSRRFAHGPSLLDRMTMSLSARVFGLFPYAMTEDDLRISQPVVSCGPVRVTLRYGYAVTLIAGLRSPSITVPIMFYRQYITSPVAVRFPWLPRLFFRDTRIRIDLAYNAPPAARLLWQGRAAGLALNADATVGQATAMDPGPSVDWLALRQDGHLLIQGFPSSPDLDLIQHRLIYHGSGDGTNAAHGTTSTVQIGYAISHLEELSAGKHVFDICLAVLDKATAPPTFLRELRAAPVVAARPLHAANAARAASGSE